MEEVRDSRKLRFENILRSQRFPDQAMLTRVTKGEEMGTKESLREALSLVTGIKHLFSFEDASVAQKMSWAAKRVTTRLEDQAYCLLGIFGVNMPPLYGEGPGAFLRLQLEIMRISNDESLFAWEDDSIESGGLLAPSPKSFRYSTDIISANPPLIERPPYLMTNRGLEIFLYFRELELEDGYAFRVNPGENQRLAPLNCAREGKISSSRCHHLPGAKCKRQLSTDSLQLYRSRRKVVAGR
jgi:hypothetical protein